jgi:hypothetical protein
VTVQTVCGGVDFASSQQRAGLAQQVGDPIRIGRALWNLGLGARFHDPQRAVEYFEQAAELARSSDAPGARDLVAAVQLDLMVGMAVMGRYRDGLAYARQAERPSVARQSAMLADALAERR